MPTTIDLTKPIRQFNGHAANYIGQDCNGHPVIEVQLTDGTWSRACVWSPAQASQTFENVPVEKPKLEGFIALNGKSYDRAHESPHFLLFLA